MWEINLGRASKVGSFLLQKTKWGQHLLLFYIQIHGYYRATGASLSKAQAEFTTNVLSNEGVRSVLHKVTVTYQSGQFHILLSQSTVTKILT